MTEQEIRDKIVNAADYEAAWEALREEEEMYDRDGRLVRIEDQIEECWSIYDEFLKPIGQAKELWK